MELKRENFVYTSCYCEENIYLLLQKLSKVYSGNRMYCVFISTMNEYFTTLYYQKAGKYHPLGRVNWDYHVIAVVEIENELFVLDFDSMLGFKVPLAEYFQKTMFAGWDTEQKNVQMNCEVVRFRVLTAETFLDHFSSDRSHMVSEEEEDQTKIEYLSPPPDYPCLKGPKASTDMDLDLFRWMDSDKYGKILKIDEFLSFFKSH